MMTTRWIPTLEQHNNWTQNKAGGWEAKDGILGPSAKPGGYIWAKGKYDNFELELDFKIGYKDPYEI